MSLDEFTNFHNKVFLPAYSDLVAFIADKPQQIIFEIENTFSHLMVYHTNLTPTISNDNLRKAHNHLIRATMDCYKMLWTEMSNNLDLIFKENNALLIFNANENDIMKLWIDFKNKAKEARNEELKNVGVDFMKAIELYKEAVDIGNNIFNKYDNIKHSKVKKFNFKTLFNQQWIGFIFGILAGISANYLWSLITT